MQDRDQRQQGMNMAGRLAALRAELARRGLDGFLVPRTDEFLGEYVPASAERLAWLSGFSGSAGLAAVTAERAALFVDGRYTLQVRQQTDPALWEYRHLIEEPVEDWLAETLAPGRKIGFDPWLHATSAVDRLREACARAGAELVAVEGNPLDAVWADRPAPPLTRAEPYDLRYAGRSSAEKRAEVGAALAKDGLDAAILSQPDSIAWLLNIRGADVPHVPLSLSFAVLHGDGTVDWFVDPRKAGSDLDAHLGNAVRRLPPDALEGVIAGLKGKTVRLDPGGAVAWFKEALQRAGATISSGADPVALPKAAKNPVELDGFRAAHRRDGAAMVRFLHWLEGAAAGGTLDEIAASDRLEAIRREDPLFRDLSFDSISGAGPNGAVIHYRATEETKRLLEPDSVYLIDSGAQYLDSTTDITRTVAIGTPPAAARTHFTLVLKGHIALAMARFPQGTTGTQLDALARLALWRHGLDYDHGTGHGVGSYLSVHEGPARIAKAPSSVALRPGMVLSNEPGYYVSGQYGIRIENLVAVRPCAALEGSERPFLEFETLTLCPIDRRLIDAALLTQEEVAWLDAYHARVRTELAPLVPAEAQDWLERATAPVL
ncbi:MAG TPA: aminopeptidase P family protein [Alphaproteobacteria bacterium]|nr:aminopeptidase P family protein [Alphaproteobacteria bacterium]